MAKRRRVVKAKGISKLWASDNIQVRPKTRHASYGRDVLKGVVIADKAADDGQRYDSSAFAYNTHTRSMGVQGKVRTERLPETKFSITQFNRVPLGEVLKRLADMRTYKPGDVSNTVASDVHVSAKHTDNFAKLLHQPSIQSDSQAWKGWYGWEKWHCVVKKKTEKEELRLYFHGNEFYYVRVVGNKISLSYRYLGKDNAEEVLFYNCIAWKEHVYAKEE